MTLFNEPFKLINESVSVWVVFALTLQLSPLFLSARFSLKAHELFILSRLWAAALTREVKLGLEACCWHVEGPTKSWKSFLLIDILIVLRCFESSANRRSHTGIKLPSWWQSRNTSITREGDRLFLHAFSFDIYTSHLDCTVKVL